jgi:hypothetical protein
MRALNRAALSVALVLVVSISIAACATRGEMKITTTWHESGSAERPLGGTIVLGITDDVDRQRYFETRFTKALTERGVRAAPAYDVLPPGGKLTKEALEAAVRDSGYESILITLLVSERNDSEYVPGMWTRSASPGGYYGYYSWAWGTAYHPGYHVDSTHLTIESHIYDTATAKLVWMAVTEVSEPDGLDDAVVSFSTMMAERLTQEVKL